MIPFFSFRSVLKPAPPTERESAVRIILSFVAGSGISLSSWAAFLSWAFWRARVSAGP